MQVLTVGRFEAEWAFRDVTGTAYGHSSDIEAVIKAADEVARRQAARVVLTPEAEEHRRSLADAGSVSVHASPAPKPKRGFREFLSRFARKKRGI